MRQVMEESELLQIITAVDEDAVKRLLDVYRESMDQLVGGFETVSYTHLDVYKRQRMMRKSPSPSR